MKSHIIQSFDESCGWTRRVVHALLFNFLALVIFGMPLRLQQILGARWQASSSSKRPAMVCKQITPEESWGTGFLSCMFTFSHRVVSAGRFISNVHQTRACSNSKVLTGGSMVRPFACLMCEAFESDTRWNSVINFPGTEAAWFCSSAKTRDRQLFNWYELIYCIIDINWYELIWYELIVCVLYMSHQNKVDGNCIAAASVADCREGWGTNLPSYIPHWVASKVDTLSALPSAVWWLQPSSTAMISSSNLPGRSEPHPVQSDECPRSGTGRYNRVEQWRNPWSCCEGWFFPQQRNALGSQPT